MASSPSPAEALDVQVTLLRIVPLTQIASSNGGTVTSDDDIQSNNLVLLVVVDSRYYWQRTPCPDFKILPYGSYNPTPDPDAPTDGSSSSGSSGSSGGSGGSGGTSTTPPVVKWEDLIAMVAGVVGATITVDPVPAAYLQPDPSLNLAGMPAGPVLDALCANIGMRLVANFDGTFQVQNATNATAARDADDSSDVAQNRRLRAGGDGFADQL